MKKVLIFCITALFTQQTVCADYWYTRYNPMPYLSSAGNWMKEHKALTGLGIAGTTLLYYYYLQQKKAQKIKDVENAWLANHFINTIITDFLPNEDFMVGELPPVSLKEKLIVFAVDLGEFAKKNHPGRPLIGVSYQPLKASAIAVYNYTESRYPDAHRPDRAILQTMQALKPYASISETKRFQDALLSHLEILLDPSSQPISYMARKRKLDRVSHWLNTLNQPGPYDKPILKGFNRKNPINCFADQNCPVIIENMRKELEVYPITIKRALQR